MRDGRDQRQPGVMGPVGLVVVCMASACVAPVEDLSAPEIALDAPLVLDLGWVARGEASHGRFTVQNVGPSAVLLDGVHAPDAQVEARLDAVVLEPGDVTEVIVQMVAGPSAVGEVVVPLRVLAPAFPPEDPRLPVVELRAQVSPSGLVAEPNPLTIGPALYLDTVTGTVAIRNLRSTPVEVFAYHHDDGRVQYDEAVTRGAFGPLPSVDGRGLITTLGAGEAFVVPIDYTAPEGEGEAKEQAVWRVGSCPDPAECALTLIVQGLPDHEAPKAVVTPTGVHFGSTPVSAEVERQLRISNDGKRSLVVSDFRFEGSSEFSVVLPTDVVLPPGEVVLLRVFYTPVDVNLDNARLTFRSNDPLQRMAEVRVTGSGVVLPPCQLEARPSSLDFGVVTVFDTRALQTVVRSVGEQRCLIFDPQIELTQGTEPGTFILDGNGPASRPLDPGEETTYEVVFVPGRPGVHTGVLRLRTSPEDSLEIPLRGRTPEDDGLTCTPNRTTEVGAPVQLVAALSRQVSARSYRWQLLSGPMDNGQIAARFVPNANSGPGVVLLPERLGTYEIQADVETESGQRFTCRTRVTTVSTGFRATLTWDGPGDLDLHLHRGGVGPWFGERDCHFDNMNPVWVPGTAAGTGPNPSLDRDDTSGEGPENIRIQTPELGVSYALAVGHFERAEGRIAEVQIFCGRATTRLEVTSRAIHGTETGACTRNDFWTIATVTFTGPDQCDVLPKDTYRTTREACMAFE